MEPTGTGLTPYKIPVDKYVLLVKVTDPDVGTYYALFDRNMMGMRSGPYTLMVEILAGGVMPQTMQLPIILLYEDQVATTDIP